MRNRHIVTIIFSAVSVVSAASAQRLEQPGSVAEGGEFKTISAQSSAERCKSTKYRVKSKVECARSDTYQAEQAKKRSHRN